MAVGALVQGVVGFGLALVAGPVLILVDPRLVPAAMLVMSAAAPWATLAQEWRYVDWGGLRWSLLGRFAGTAVGVWLVAVLTSDGIGVAVAVMVLVSVAVSVSGVHIAVTRPRLVAAGALGGVGGTATGIGGPPLALLYQDSGGPQIRATLAGFFAVGQLVSLGALLGSGVVEPRVALTGLTLIPATLLGAWAARHLRGHADARRMRPAVLVVATLSAVVLLVRALV